MTKTIENIKAAFAGESQANRKYLAFAKQAEKDGFKQIARLFRAVADAETVHAHNHLKVMEGIGSTEENLKAAVNGESYEVTEMYPAFIEDGNAEDNKKAVRSFKFALETEKIHEGMYRTALESLQSGKDLPETQYYVCPVCGYTHEGTPPEKCPICGTLGSKFILSE